jgi:uncharacterized membrane protein
MGKNRLEAFSDGVITIMVLGLKVPHGATINALLPLWPVFLSFIYIGIYWNKLQYANHPPFDMKITLLVLPGLALIALCVRFDSRRRTAKVAFSEGVGAILITIMEQRGP